ncbi:hypothetical protein DSCW_10570 [Desulfosarcina widdelii]|uniref:Polyketide synthase n=1 Tax=Desulfosarcina widdelii TaxID=947919 RepID=A0A5K7YZ12_9BACT|nr:type I polyketide synthase [Desulfosarcina widdelii]BBO73640.1 hypothetical protein DSCW_10570 [Desulfosarcina widdelii]
MNKKPYQQPVAIIGMGGMFAGSANVKDYWRVLLNGVDCISDPPASHKPLNDYLDGDPKRPDHIYCNRGGFLPEMPFDPTEFGIPPAALEATDTSQLLGLVAAKMALTDAGYGDDRDYDREHTSVILGVTGTQELVISLGSRLGHPYWRRSLEGKGLSDEQKKSILDDIADSYVPWQENSFPGLLGNVVAGRICNRLNLGGTNCVVDAACASSMGAIHLALMELAAGKSEMVVTGGVDTINDIFMHMCFSKTGVLSHTGDARPFSADADGTVLGEGIGILVLKRLEDAQRDGDRIYALIRGIGSSSDGKSQSIYAPRAEGQMRALAEAYRNAGIDPETVALVEAHGTGTRVGDQVEFTALKNVFGTATPNGNRCALGSVKSMIGHTKAAAGAAGLIKSALSLYNKVLPPTIKADSPDPKLGIESSPFYLNTVARPWFSKNGTPRRGGVSSFGFGGSNFHVVLEEYAPDKKEIAWDGSVEILAFSGSDADAIIGKLKDLDHQLKDETTTAQLARMAQSLRHRFSSADLFRLVTVIDTALGSRPIRKRLDEALGIVAGGQSKSVPSSGIYFHTGGSSAGKIAFLFPGQGSQYPYMGRDLVCLFPDAMGAIETANTHCDLDAPLWELLFPRPALDKEQKRFQVEALRRTDVAQPAIGSVSLAMLSILEFFNLRPDAVCGHSYGELPALYTAGRIDRKTLQHLSALRGRLMAEAGRGGDAGSMLAVKAPADELEQVVKQHPDVVVANVNSPDQGVLSGPTTAIDAAKADCNAKGYRSVALPVAAAFHSPIVADAARTFSHALESIAFTTGKIPVYANATAEPYPDDPQAGIELLGRQMTSSVQFQRTVEQLYASGVRTFIEVGPKTVLSGLVRATLKMDDVSVVPLDRSAGKASGILDLAHAIGQLAAFGVGLDLTRWEKEAPASRKQKMVIPLSGANYRSPRKTQPKSETREAVRPTPVRSAPSASPQPPETSSNSQTTMRSAEKNNHFKTAAGYPPASTGPTQPPDSTTMDNTLAIVRQGLASMQSLQEQTALAHQKFLEAQAQASRTLQEMMQSARLAAGLPPNETGVPVAEQTPLPVYTQPVSPQPPPEPLPVTPVVPATSAASAPPAEPAIVTTPAVARTQNIELKPEPASKSNAKMDGSDTVATTLLSVVSELTGYPVDMLGLEMDIEADLGIDSIKRVEILSAMEERMPQLPQVTPDMVGSLKTLGQICDFLAAEETSSSSVENSCQTPEASNSDADAAVAVQNTLLSVVSELTGYPVDMLGLEMDIEADLGIDSIKRVEILSAMEERMPQLPQVTPDMVGSLKTLGQICYFLAAEETSSSSVENSCQTPEASNSDADAAVAVQNTLLSVVSELTGYPVDMLGLEMDIEADLGIDSIKRVEILSAMEERMPQLPQVTPDMVGSLKTLGQICDFLAGGGSAIAAQLEPAIPQPVTSEPNTTSIEIPRQIVDVVVLPEQSGRKLRIAAGRWIGVLDDKTDFVKAVVRCLEKSDFSCRMLDKDQIADASNLSGLTGLILCEGTDPETAFLAAKAAAAKLSDAALTGDAFFAAITRLDGAFGFTGNPFDHAEQGALAGLVKTARLEWPSVACRVLDISPDFNDIELAAERAVAELLTVSPQDPVEIGLFPGKRVTLQPVPAETSDGILDLKSSDVVAITGGARGVTAACALALAHASGAAIALIGRSPAPFQVPSWLAGIQDEAAMKKAIVNHAFADAQPTPKELEAEFKRQKANQAIAGILQHLADAGVQAAYFSADVTRAEGLKSAFSKIRKNLGQISAVIHGAGVLHDRLIVDKSPEQFRQVYSTKVQGFKNLIEVTASDRLRHLVLFSSVSARTGNTGQCDYAMANEVLNKMARVVAQQRPDCRVSAINWGPWDGGMVTPSLKKAFQEQHIDLIPVEAGADFMVAEMKNADPAPVEVLIGSMLETPSVEDEANETAMGLLERRELDLLRYPVLASHVIGGKPVVPFALIGEWIGHGAVKENPGFTLHGIDDFRLLSGIRIEQEKKLVRLLAGKARKNGNGWHVAVELRNGVKNGKDVIHSRARALLVDRLPDAPTYKGNGKNGSRPYPRDLDAVYGEILFHGDQLRAIQHIEAYSDHGMTARLTGAPKPEAWMQDPIRERWTADPMVLDGAFQMAIVWCFEQTGSVCLPSYAQSYRQYRPSFPESGVTAVMTVTRHTHRKMVADFTFLDADEQIIATLTGYEATVDQALIHAFRNNTQTSVIQENRS